MGITARYGPTGVSRTHYPLSVTLPPDRCTTGPDEGYTGLTIFDPENLNMQIVLKMQIVVMLIRPFSWVWNQSFLMRIP
jgi:hypothetical protein